MSRGRSSRRPRPPVRGKAVGLLRRLFGGGKVEGNQLYVVLFSQVAHEYHRGDVVTEAQLGSDVEYEFDPDDPRGRRQKAGAGHPRLARYLALGAVRPVTPEEAEVAARLAKEGKAPRLTLDAPFRPAASIDAELERVKKQQGEALGRAAHHELKHAEAAGIIRALESQLAVAQKQAARVAEVESALSRLQQQLDAMKAAEALAAAKGHAGKTKGAA